jgi:hypothetical protein
VADGQGDEVGALSMRVDLLSGGGALMLRTHCFQSDDLPGHPRATAMLIRNATLPDGRTGIDLLVQQGRIAAVGPALFHGPRPRACE